jgi:phosphatidate cytidylyltransferase
MNNFTKRLIFGAIYVGVLTFGILFSKISFISLFFALMLVTLYEFTTIINLKSVFPYIIAVLLFIFANVLNVKDIPSRLLSDYAGIALFLSFFGAFISILFAKKDEVVSHLGKIFLSIIYIAVPFTLIAQIPFINNEFTFVNTTILGVFILIWVNDSFAYLIGKNFGKHKLLERISPNKTIEGFVGGMVFTFIGGYILSLYFTKMTMVNWLVFAAIVSIFGVLGDLIESMFKRQAGAKDSSNFIPGHGGFLDRLDSVIFAAPFIFIYLLVIS